MMDLEPKNEAALVKRTEMARKKFSAGYNCAQAVFYSFCDLLGFSPDLALKLACGFGAGMGRKQEVCGAISGGVMVISALYGRGENEGADWTALTYAKTRELMDRFAEKHETCICRKLLNGCVLTTPEGQAEFKEKDLFNKVCQECVSSVVEILETMLEEGRESVGEL
jgi:C_GCAxxG_C_C family probable redox protein